MEKRGRKDGKHKGEEDRGGKEEGQQAVDGVEVENRRGREGARDGAERDGGEAWREREVKWGEGKKDRGVEHWLRDPDSQGFTQNTFLS